MSQLSQNQPSGSESASLSYTNGILYGSGLSYDIRMHARALVYMVWGYKYS